MKIFPCGESHQTSVIPPYKRRFPEWFKRAGEKRPPSKGEWYLSGAIPAAYRAPTDLSEEYYIAIPISDPPKEIIQGGFIYKLYTPK